MTDKGRPEDDEEDRETLAGDTSMPRGVPTEPDADMVSLPPRPFGKRPPPPPPPAPPKRPPSDADETPTGEASPSMAEPTVAPLPGGATVADSPSSTEVPTREVDVEREMPTIVGSFAASTASSATSPPPEEAETVVEPGSQQSGPSGGPRATPGTDQSARTPGYRSPLGKVVSKTARDPIVGTAAQRGTTPGGASAPVSLGEGQLLADRYELIERLGKGGMGEVWKAKHTLLQGLRAIKVIKASISKDPSFRQRFLQEGQTMMRVKDPGVVEVTDLDETRQNRELFMVMEYLKGRTIYDAVRSKDKPLAADVRNAVRILVEVAKGMQRIHDERIVHKDLKTDNVLLVVSEADGLEHPKVIDFGLAKRLGEKDAVAVDAVSPSPPPISDSDLHTTLSGTLAYMAPEQFRHEPSSFQSDVYAFGVMAYEVFTKGEYPVPRGPLQHYLELHTKGTEAGRIAQKRPDLDPKLTAILDQCIETDRAKRPESFREVARRLQYWLDTPERLKRRRQVVLMTTGIAAIALFGIWAYFFGGEKTASLSNLAMSSGATKVAFDGKTAHLPAAALASLTLTADIAGKSGEPVLEVDGRSRRITSDHRGGQISVTADVSDLADGTHQMALRASAGAAPVNVALDVDRVAPPIRGISVRGATASPTGVFTNAQSPEVVVDVGEPAARIREVEAVSASGTPITAQHDGDSDRWVLKGTSNGDGRVDLEVTVRDEAGNASQAKFSYERDTKAPGIKIADTFPRLRQLGPGVRVRSAAGAKLRLTCDEPAEVTATIGEASPTTVHADARTAVEFDLPPLDAEKPLAVRISARDAAQNVTEEQTQVAVVPDVVRIMNVDTSSRMVLRGDVEWPQPEKSPPIIVVRTYPDGSDVRLLARRIRDANGQDVPGATPRVLELPTLNNADEGQTLVKPVSKDAFPEGAWTVTAAVGGETQTMPLEVVFDSAPPKIVSVTVAQADGREIPTGGWALAPDVVVTVVVADLDLARVELDGVKAEGELGPGTRTYKFSKHLDHEGLSGLALAVADGAGHTTDQTVSVNGDWSVPSVTLTQPRSDAAYNDRDAVRFDGTCSESAYRLHVDLPDGTPRAANCDTKDFSQEFPLPAGEPLTVAVWVEDLAGHRSPTTTLKLAVIHVATELPPEIAWAQGVSTKMEKVERGDVVIGGRVRAVSLAFVDKCEVTNRAYRAFLDATQGGHGAWCSKDEPKGWDHTPTAATWKDAKWNGDDLPVVNVAYWDAYAFAAWSGRRLPTEAEWVKAAAKSRSAAETELRMWPPFAADEAWKNGVVVTSDWAKGPASAIAGEDVSPVGCLHMGGNVSEWVDLPEAVDGSPAGTRGGSWFFSRRAADIRDTPAKAWDRAFRANTIGFRCAVDAALVHP